MDILKHIEIVKDFPKTGINFYDIQSLMSQPAIWEEIIDTMASLTRAYEPDLIAGLESRGFLVGLPVAQKLGLPFAMIRKKGKLPGQTIAQEYDLEYGSDCIEIQREALKPGQRVAILDDLLATGGTMAAATDLIRTAGADPLCGICLIELDGLSGRARIGDLPFEALCQALA